MIEELACLDFEMPMIHQKTPYEVDQIAAEAAKEVVQNVADQIAAEAAKEVDQIVDDQIVVAQIVAEAAN